MAGNDDAGKSGRWKPVQAPAFKPLSGVLTYLTAAKSPNRFLSRMNTGSNLSVKKITLAVIRREIRRNNSGQKDR